jgi:hypothetical protein
VDGHRRWRTFSSGENSWPPLGRFRVRQRGRICPPLGRISCPPTAGSKGEHAFGVVLLSCGHPDVVVVHPGKSIAATLKRYDWECPDSGATATATRVLTVLSEAAYENMGQEAFDLLVSTGAAS